ncbi:MAG: cupin domain-containing protein [Clostridiales bacterium]|nr:cupin domain-containing protein [Clostridiales bacterium]
MHIDFDQVEEQLIQQPRGGQGTFGIRQYVTEHNRVFRGRLLPGSGFGLHSHDTSSETMFFISGTGKMVTPAGEERVFPGAVQHCPKGGSHYLVNDGEEDLVFYGVIPEHGA